MERVLANIDGIKIFLDDIILFSKDKESHYELLNEVLERLKAADVSLNIGKCEFFMKSIKYLGFVIEKDTMSADLDAFDRKKLTSKPTTRRQLRKMIGYINWYRPFVPYLSEKIASLNEKLKCDKVCWKNEDQHLIEEIVGIIEENIKLHLPDYQKPFVLYTDASDNGISGILTQNNTIIRIFSAKLKDSEMKYNIMEKELLAVLRSLQKFRSIIFDNKVTVMTDNNNLTFEKAIDSSRSQKWKLVLSEYNYEFKHIPGNINTGADYLSRLYNSDKIMENKLPFAKEDSQPNNNLNLIMELKENDKETKNKMKGIS
eukprot:GAHX01001416.1.p2 GENE.GAHX01001416.1~~GAHX01001416.1.p2  ORF type:complete len:316 (-),score=61.43 GAHX01001416.1:1150-2097(-)